jgi:uncharacterized metal-binding protein
MLARVPTDRSVFDQVRIAQTRRRIQKVARLSDAGRGRNAPARAHSASRSLLTINGCTYSAMRDRQVERRGWPAPRHSTAA